MTEEEKWIEIDGFNGRYSVSNMGRVKSHYRGKIRKPYLDRGGYLCITLKPSPRDKSIPCKVHRLVCAAFHGPPPPRADVAHYDGDRTNNRATNLRWATREENMADCLRMGTVARGNMLPQAALTADKVLELRRLHAEGASIQGLARRYAIAFASAYKVVHRKSWKHV